MTKSLHINVGKIIQVGCRYTKYYEERALYSNSNLRELPQKMYCALNLMFFSYLLHTI